MAEAVVSLVVERISDLLIHHALLLFGVREEVKRLQAELKRMHCFLKDADLKQDQDERVRNWVAEIRDVAYDAEDIIDTFIVEVAGARAGDDEKVSCCVPPIFSKGGVRTKKKISQQIISVHNRIADISSGLQTYGIKSIGEGQVGRSVEMQRRLRRSFPHTEEEIISLASSTKDVMDQLMIEEEKIRVVSIVGMGGIGKTTLAKKVYNHVDVKRHFDRYGWAFVSQQCATKDVLQGILSKVSRDMGSYTKTMREEDLVERLQDVLGNKRYLVVLDDIWRKEDWDILKPAFPNGKKGSKILFTTRNRDVAFHADPWSSPVEPPFLTEDESWELLCRKAFPRDVVANRGWPQDFETLGREMVQKCGGLPLAVVVLGGLLATKRSLDEWDAVRKNINAHLIKFEHQYYEGVNWILDLSYQDLPFHLKPCFLYLGIFPEDSKISKTKLVRLWIAEGLIPQLPEGEEHVTLEDQAEIYMENLINRCMVQVDQRDCTGRGIKTCRVHDLMRDLCISKAREDGFLKIIEPQSHVSQTNRRVVVHSATVKMRRIAIHPLKQDTPVVQGYAYLRSLLYVVQGMHAQNYSSLRHQDVPSISSRQEVSMFEEFRLLRVLELERIRVRDDDQVPKEIGNLIHLRYLGLRSSWQTRLPTSIAELRSLQTLDIRTFGGEVFVKVPRVATKLVNLRHLLTDGIGEGYCQMDTYTNLQILKKVYFSDLARGDAISKLTSLRKLAIMFRSSEEVETFLLSPIASDCRLQSLSMQMQDKRFLNLRSLSSIRSLAKLEISGKILDSSQNYHNLEFLPGNLSKLILYDSELHQDPMPFLEKLPNLRSLHLSRSSYSKSHMVCSAMGFPHLEILRLVSLWNLECWNVAEGAMPSLQRLNISGLPKLRMIPEGLKSVTTLRELTIDCMASGFARRIQVVDGVEGADFYKVRHVPSILT